MAPLLVALAVALCAGLATLALTRVPHPWKQRAVADDPPPPSKLLPIVVAVVGLAAIAILLGGLAESFERQTPVLRWDETVERWAAVHAGPLGTDALRITTHMGDTVTIIAIAIVVAVALLFAGHVRLALFLATVVIGQWLIANLAKELVQRTRPELDPLASFSGFSFPSGHSTAAAATYLALALIVIALRPAWRRNVLVAGAVSIAVAVAASRALLGVHWFSDVIGGLMLGWCWCFVCAMLYGVLSKRPAPSVSTSTTT